MSNVTAHAIRRTQERAGKKERSSEEFIEKALKYGKPPGAFFANERNFLKAKETKGDCSILVYQSFIFIVDNDGRCVTMYAVPKWFGKKRCYDGKIKIKNLKKYLRFNCIPDEAVA